VLYQRQDRGPAPRPPRSLRCSSPPEGIRAKPQPLAPKIGCVRSRRQGRQDGELRGSSHEPGPILSRPKRSDHRDHRARRRRPPRDLALKAVHSSCPRASAKRSPRRAADGLTVSRRSTRSPARDRVPINELKTNTLSSSPQHSARPGLSDYTVSSNIEGNRHARHLVEMDITRRSSPT